jgi:hypothetical protein
MWQEELDRGINFGRVDVLLQVHGETVYLESICETTIGIGDLVEWENGVGWAFGV